MLNDDFQKVLEEYLEAREENDYTSAPIAHHIQQTLKNEVSDLVEDSTYKITASAGVGRLSEIPWIGVFKPDNDNNIASGYFFKADMTGVYLVLRVFNYAELEERYGVFVPEHLRTKAIHIKALLGNSPFDINYFDETFDLNSKSKTADIHKSGMILCKLYEKDNIPSEEILKNDLKQIIKIQDYIYDNYSDNMYLTVDEWIEALEDENLIDNKTLNILEINYNFEDHTASYDDIIKKREELGYPNEKTYNSNIVNTSKRLKERFNKTEIYGNDEKEIWVPRFFYGARKRNQEGKRVFYNTLREELVEALENYDKSKRPDRINIDMLPKDTTSKENEIGSESIRYWLISPGEGAGWWDEFCQNGDVGIGYSGTGDLNQYNSQDEIAHKLQEIRDDETYPTNDSLACWQFVHDMKIGDVIFVRKGTKTIIGRGIVESDYMYDTNKPYHKLRKVTWTHNGNWDSPYTFSIKTLTEIIDNQKLANINKLFEKKKYDSFYDYLIDEGYYFSRETIENYLLSLKIKPFVILTGNSGTGKTKLSQLFAKYLNEKDNYKIIPVGANWTENRHILGYFNIIKNEPQYTPAYYLIEKSQEKSYPHFLILDEMNLSHVERYFADFLSAIESNEAIPLHGEDELEIPPNLFIIGTVNVDETTYMFSPKVLDRANTIEFKTYSAKDYMTNKFNMVKPKGDIGYLEDILIDQEIWGKPIQEMSIQELEQQFDNDEFWEEYSDEMFKFQNILRKAGFDFGFRVINEITRFMLAAYKYEDEPKNWTNWKRYFDAQIKQKMLPKLHGSQKVIGETLNELLQACDDYPTSKAKLEEMIDVLDKQRYVSFIN
ncbi:MrcB family domain-containing protein [Methanobrevibacter thaueri]|uniref:AAA domain protein n=1 Tax=Methanobrevibacter thaueri TaxID=190975 RepID=A0A315XLU4_9EURY|nr:DUF3578 domain-containing protein [Methanobrevibacter thaueri]PWB87296.1 AAA domain protein [Methanobrevibacter thaueri]